MDRSADALWSSRARAFWRDSLPYIRYMAQSGLPGVTIMLLFAGLAGYASLLHHLPESFPYTLVGVVVLDSDCLLESAADMAARGGYRLSGTAGISDGSLFETIVSI